MNKAMVVVSTCPRQVSYLPATLEALDDNGSDVFEYKLVVADGSVPALRHGWDIWGFPGPSGTRVQLWRIFKLFADSDADQLLLCEDDIVAAKNALQYIRNFPIPDHLAFVTFFEMKELDDSASPGLYEIATYGLWGDGPHGRVHTKFYCGCQCVLFPRRTIEYLLTCDPFDKDAPTDKWISKLSSSDCMMGWHLSKSPWLNYGAHIPNLVEHVGAVSAASNAELHARRRAAVFLGQDVDALSLSRPTLRPLTVPQQPPEPS